MEGDMKMTKSIDALIEINIVYCRFLNAKIFQSRILNNIASERCWLLQI